MKNATRGLKQALQALKPRHIRSFLFFPKYELEVLMSDDVQWVLWNFLRTAHSKPGADPADADFEQLLVRLQGLKQLETAQVETWPDPALAAFREVVQDFLSDIFEAEQAGMSDYCDQRMLKDAMPGRLAGPILTEITQRSGGGGNVHQIRKLS